MNHASKVSSHVVMTKLMEIPMKQPNLVPLKRFPSGVLKPKQQERNMHTPVIKEVDKQVVSPILSLLLTDRQYVMKCKESEFVLVVKSNKSAEATAASKHQDRRNDTKKLFLQCRLELCHKFVRIQGLKLRQKATADAGACNVIRLSIRHAATERSLRIKTDLNDA